MVLSLPVGAGSWGVLCRSSKCSWLEPCPHSCLQLWKAPSSVASCWWDHSMLFSFSFLVFLPKSMTQCFKTCWSFSWCYFTPLASRLGDAHLRVVLNSALQRTPYGLRKKPPVRSSAAQHNSASWSTGDQLSSEGVLWNSRIAFQIPSWGLEWVSFQGSAIDWGKQE